ncbi:MAG: glycosyl transferase [Bacteroidetes bacterium B1(2017)]|nr:MAG: glycosyl transferase [Bacteroidetes bacterium B1(2017)]
MPHLEIHYLTKPEYKIILENNTYIHQIHLLDKHPILKAAELKNQNYDLVIDLHNNLRTAQIKSVLGITAYSFPKLNFEKFLMVNFKFNILPPVHIVDRYLSTTKSLGILNDGLGLDYTIPEKDIVKEFEGFIPNKQPYYTWAIGAQHFTKRLPNERIISLIKTLDLPVVLLGGKDDVQNAEHIKKAIGSNCLVACGKLNLNQSASLVQQSVKLFTNDTGLMHIAAALQIPTVSFWGNTIPQFGMTPYYGVINSHSSIIENTHLSCRPCSKIGFNACPKGHFKCMKESMA